LSAYTTKTQAEAWNLPAIKLNATLDYTINPKWYAGADVFFVGSRKDSQINNDLMTIVAQTYIPTTLKSYIDLNAHVGYKHSERLTAFLKANNILNQSYQKWMNYPVQGFQVVLGANYKFDF
jgi:outer membrane receptor protein involved in Fe transport